MKYFWGLALFLILLGCDSDPGNRNPFLQEVRFRFELDLNLPAYVNLNTIGNPVFVDNPGVGIRGAFVMRNGLDSFIAFEASCPNQTPSACSTMEIEGQNVVCPCDGLTYSLFTGQLLNRPDDGNRYFDLLFYRTTFNGNVVTISN